MNVVIEVDDPGADDVRALLDTHLEFSWQATPVGYAFALGADSLDEPGMTFFAARLDRRLVGIGALRRLDTTHAEIKSMHTHQEARGHGVGRAMVEHLLAFARHQGYRRVSLETGATDAYAPARALYGRAGFRPCEAFGDYAPSPHNTFFTMTLDAGAPGGHGPTGSDGPPPPTVSDVTGCQKSTGQVLSASTVEATGGSHEGPGAVGSLLDLLMADAWPPLEEAHEGTWRFRWTTGATWRANSVLAIGSDGGLEHLVDRAEAFYSAKAAPVRVLVSEASSPAGLAAYLAARGYRPDKPTLMMTADTVEVGRRTGAGGGPWDLRVAPAVDDDWFEAYWSVEAARGRTRRHAAIYRRVLLAPDRPQRLVAGVAGDGVVAGTGQGVLDAGWCGVQCMATRSAYRRRGVASAVLATLAVEAAAAGADRMYLAVQADNEGAVSLYKRAGFRPAHRYGYWCRDGG